MDDSRSSGFRKPFHSSRLRLEQSLVQWATPQLHDIDALAKMVDPTLKGLYPAKFLSRFADEMPNTSLKTRKVIVELCNIVATRGARLSAVGIMGILRKLGRDTIKEGEKQRSVQAMDGGLFEHYKEFSKCLESTLNELLGEEVSKSIVIEHANDGSGIIL